nr:hypothetical protein [Geminicoccus harenae]
MDLLAEPVGARAEQGGPAYGRQRVGEQEAGPGHPAGASQHARERAQEGDEPAEEHDRAAMVGEQVLAELQPLMGQPDMPAVAAEQGQS